MINYVKLQCNLMKEIDNEKKCKFLRVYFDDNDLLIANQYIAYRIPENKIYLNCTSLQSMHGLVNILSYPITSHEWYITDRIIKYSDIENKLAYQFNNEHGEYMFIDKKLFDTLNFKPGDNLQFYASNKHSVMKICQNNVCICSVMPVKVKEI